MLESNRPLVVILLLLLLSLFTWVGSVWARDEAPTIVTSFTILEDFVRNVAGDEADVRVLAPRGAEIHEWVLTPKNFVHIEEAQIIFYNGLNIEQWMGQVEAIASHEVPIIPLGEISGYPTLPIVTGDFMGEKDPHIWMDVRGAISYVEAICHTLMEFDPVRAHEYQENARNYREELLSLHKELKDSLAEIPGNERILITSEAAFLYFANAYGFYHDGIWGTNTEEEGTPKQLIRIHEVILEKRPPAIFWESTGSPQYSLSIAQDTKVPVSGPLYVDSLGEKGSQAGTYIGMMRENSRLLLEVFLPREE